MLFVGVGFLFSLVMLTVFARADETALAEPTALTWDADSKDYNAQPGDASASFSFVATNVSDHEVLITRLRTSCGCTVAELPVTPCKHLPGCPIREGLWPSQKLRSGKVPDWQ